MGSNCSSYLWPWWSGQLQPSPAGPQSAEAQAQGQRSNIYVCLGVLTMLPYRRAGDNVCTTHQEAARAAVYLGMYCG